jgi:hypothetical protein
MRLSFLIPLLMLCGTSMYAQNLSDADIQAAMERGGSIPAKKLWEDIKKKQLYRLNRAGFGDPIEKKVKVDPIVKTIFRPQ